MPGGAGVRYPWPGRAGQLDTPVGRQGAENAWQEGSRQGGWAGGGPVVPVTHPSATLYVQQLSVTRDGHKLLRETV